MPQDGHLTSQVPDVPERCYLGPHASSCVDKFGVKPMKLSEATFIDDQIDKFNLIIHAPVKPTHTQLCKAWEKLWMAINTGIKIEEIEDGTRSCCESSDPEDDSQIHGWYEKVWMYHGEDGHTYIRLD